MARNRRTSCPRSYGKNKVGRKVFKKTVMKTVCVYSKKHRKPRKHFPKKYGYHGKKRRSSESKSYSMSMSVGAAEP